MASNPVTAAFALAVIIAIIIVAIVVSNNKIYGNLGPLITDYGSLDNANKICNSMYGNGNTYWEFGDRTEQVRTFVPNEFGKDSDKAALFYRKEIDLRMHFVKINVLN